MTKTEDRSSPNRDQRSIILPLHPKWANQVLKGSKTVEIRKTFARKDALPTLALIYTTQPVKAIEGVVTLTGIETKTLEELMALKGETQVEDEHLKTYLGNRTGLAVFLAQPRKLRTPIPLSEMRAWGHEAPQSFCFATKEFENHVLAGGFA